jgi:polyphenol oxidase
MSSRAAEAALVALDEPLPREEFATAAWPHLRLGWTLFDARDPGRDTPAQARRLGAAVARNAVYLKQVHGTECLVLAEGQPIPERPAVADGILTDRRDLLVGVSAADCLPLFLVSRRATGVLHAGWRGVLGGILPVAMEVLRTRFRVEAAELDLFMGPGIGPCCFHVSPAVWTLFPPAARRGDAGPLRLDLAAAVLEQWQGCGGSTAVTRLGRCTVCSSPRLHSYRRDGSNGRNFAYLYQV